MPGGAAVDGFPRQVRRSSVEHVGVGRIESQRGDVLHLHVGLRRDSAPSGAAVSGKKNAFGCAGGERTGIDRRHRERFDARSAKSRPKPARFRLRPCSHRRRSPANRRHPDQRNNAAIPVGSIRTELKTPGVPRGKGSRRQDAPASSERNSNESREPATSVRPFRGSIAMARALPPNGPANFHPPITGSAATRSNARPRAGCLPSFLSGTSYYHIKKQRLGVYW